MRKSLRYGNVELTKCAGLQLPAPASGKARRWVDGLQPPIKNSWLRPYVNILCWKPDTFYTRTRTGINLFYIKT